MRIKAQKCTNDLWRQGSGEPALRGGAYSDLLDP